MYQNIIMLKFIKFLTGCIILYVLIYYCLGQQIYDRLDCESKRTCGECIQVLNCSWQIILDDSSQDHCKSSINSNDNNIINPQTEFLVTNDDTSHINPKVVDLKIRVGQSYKLNFEYNYKIDYPIDMYFLMDMSKSMEHYSKKLSELASDLVRTMKEKTKDVKIGFGSFVDKSILPYANALPNKIKKPCEICVNPYSFKNHLKLTDDVDTFSKKVSNASISGNIDGPEGSLEALLQTIVCANEIGWRPEARHLIILSTDDAFHVAGDGKLAGIVKPNDGHCHLHNDEYTHALLQDYPSIGQIRTKAIEENMIILFVVSPSQRKLYSKLKNSIKDSHLGILEANSENILHLITDIYESIIESFTIDHNFPRNNFDIGILSKNCPTFANNTCKDIKNDNTYKFSANIKFNRCPENKIYTRNYFIKPSSINEVINIKVQMLCDCTCEYIGEEHYEENSDECNKNGDLQCGICKCKENKIGSKCQCDAKSNIQNIDDIKLCIKINATEPCSGVGVCKCGQCECQKPYNGTYCECNDDYCKTSKDSNEICSGHGMCNCRACNCFAGWTGDKCDCSLDRDSCKSSSNSIECSGNGECICGKCICTNKDKYGGKYCEDCKTCPKTCNDFIYCVKCYFNSLNCDAECAKYNITETNIKSMNITENVCTHVDEINCVITYSYNYNKDDSSVIIFTQKECVTPVAAGFKYLGFIIASIFIAGIIAMLIWKARLIVKDRREYALFECEWKGDTKWTAQENPTYKSATTHFQNPLFQKSN